MRVHTSSLVRDPGTGPDKLAIYSVSLSLSFGPIKDAFIALCTVIYVVQQAVGRLYCPPDCNLGAVYNSRPQRPSRVSIHV